MVGGEQSRTSINNDGISSSWEADDRIALWANADNGNATLSAVPFQIYYRDIPASKALFTASLTSAMEEGTYNYFATYPVPTDVNGTKATFTLPATQNGLMGNGAAIMIATPTQGAQLGIVTGDSNSSNAYEIEDNHISLKMNHATHALRFFIPSDKWGFEDDFVNRIVVTMPQNIAGDVTLDYTNPSSKPEVSESNSVKTIELILDKAIRPSASAALIEQACAAIIPTNDFAEGDKMVIKAYSPTQMATYSVSLAGRKAMQAGHITPIGIDCSSPTELPRLKFRITTNNLGEEPYKITLKSDIGNFKWTSNSNNTYTYFTGSEDVTISKGNGFDIAYDENYIETIKGKTITVTYESANAIVSNTINMPDTLAVGDSPTIELEVPYLFFEDFSSLEKYDGDYTSGPYTSTDAASTTAKDLSEYGLSSGWTGARTGCDVAGTAILVSGRVDAVVLGATRAYGRLDSPALNSIKSGASVNVKVKFKYSGNEDENLSYYYPVAKFGYTLDTGALNGYATQFNNDEAFDGISGMVAVPDVPTDGSASNTNKTLEYDLNNCTSSHRLTWHVMQYGYKRWAVNNDYGWLYVDDIKVQI